MELFSYHFVFVGCVEPEQSHPTPPVKSFWAAGPSPSTPKLHFHEPRPNAPLGQNETEEAFFCQRAEGRRPGIKKRRGSGQCELTGTVPTNGPLLTVTLAAAALPHHRGERSLSPRDRPTWPPRSVGGPTPPPTPWRSTLRAPPPTRR